jgi:hypothetical protein
MSASFTPRRRRFAASAALVVSALLGFSAAPRASAQAVAGQGSVTTFRDTALLKPPAGHPVAILDFEDLECPACAHASPIVHAAVEHYKIPLLRHDWPLAMHVWSRDAAITARYLQDKVSPDAADTFRKDVFANQTGIASKDDLSNFTRKWFAGHNQQLPFVIDGSGRFAAEVQADATMAERLGLNHTPTIVVLGPKGWTEILDVTQLYTVIDKTLAQVPTAVAVQNKHQKPHTRQQ